MMTRKGSGIFGVPGGETTVETPDGVTKTATDGHAYNSLTNSGWAHGGPDGRGYGGLYGRETGCRDGFMIGPCSETPDGKIKIR